MKYKVLGNEGETVELVPAVEASEGVEAKEAQTAAVGSEVELDESVGGPLVDAGTLEPIGE